MRVRCPNIILFSFDGYWLHCAFSSLFGSISTIAFDTVVLETDFSYFYFFSEVRMVTMMMVVCEAGLGDTHYLFPVTIKYNIRWKSGCLSHRW